MVQRRLEWVGIVRGYPHLRSSSRVMGGQSNRRVCPRHRQRAVAQVVRGRLEVCLLPVQPYHLGVPVGLTYLSEAQITRCGTNGTAAVGAAGNRLGVSSPPIQTRCHGGPIGLTYLSEAQTARCGTSGGREFL